MARYGQFNPAHPIESLGDARPANVYYNQGYAALAQSAIERREGDLAPGGALVVRTGVHTGRSPRDKFVVDEPSVKDEIWREANPPMSPEHFARLKADMLAHMSGRDYFAQDLIGGADPEHALPVRVITELAWHGLFIRTMLREPDRAELAGFAPQFTILNCPSFAAEPVKHGCRSSTVIAISLEQKLVLIGGTEYAGENKKSVFTLLNYLLPAKGVMPMHCSANHAIGDPSDSAVFFGLSGTGKTTLSADPDRTLIGDDEHGWSDGGLFNFEGGCYAKTARLSAQAEPAIHATTSMFGSVLENVVMAPDTRALDFDDLSLTENTRVSYPLAAIANASNTGRAGPPRNLFMLTCDAFGVLPPIARLSPAQAMYHFLSGFTAKVAGTEKGVTEPQPTFSTCFGAPFLPRRPEVYGELLMKRIAETGATCWLVSTGWTGGGYGEGRRMPIHATRALLTAALTGDLARGEFVRDPQFGFEIPKDCPGVDAKLLNPRETWADPAAYDAQAAKLRGMFADNFAQFEGVVGDDVRRIALKAA